VSFFDEIKNNKLYQFVLIGGVLYVGWLLLYYSYITQETNWDYLLNLNIGELTVKFFSWFNVEVMLEIDSDHIIVTFPYPMKGGVWVGDNCNGFKLFSIFSIFILAYPSNWKSKVWFIPLGLIVVHLANILRIMALMLISSSHPEYLDFNHDYTFTIFVYSIIFGLWYWWLKKYSNSNEKK